MLISVATDRRLDIFFTKYKVCSERFLISCFRVNLGVRGAVKRFETQPHASF